jgi:dienelactone hydrolase
MLIGVRRVELSRPAGVRWVPDEHRGVGVLVLAGSSGRVDESRARVVAGQGYIAESVQWFGGPGQNAGPWEIPLETFQRRVADLACDCDRVYLVGTSFGAEVALVTAAQTPGIDGVVAFAPSDVIWAGIDPAGRQASHWSFDGDPLAFIAFDESWQPDGDPPGFRSLYLRSRHAADPAAIAAATIAVERIPGVITVAGEDDQVWPSGLHAENIRSRRAAHGMETTAVTGDEAGHRAILPGEPVISGGVRMRRGGTETADRRLGQLAWGGMLRLLAGGASAPETT